MRRVLFAIILAALVSAFSPADDGSAFWEMMRKADRLSDRRQAIEVLEATRHQFPDREFEVNWKLAMAYAETGQYEKTLEIWDAGHTLNFFYGLPDLNWQELDWLKPLEKLPRFQSIFDRDKELMEQAQKTAIMTYDMVTPANYSRTRKYPLFLVLHGGGDSADRARSYWRSSTLNHDYLAAYIQSPYPLSSKTYTWKGYNTGKVTEMRAQLRKLYEEIVAKYPVDTSRVLIGGMSAGGMVSLDVVFRNVLPVTGFVVNCPVVPSDFEPSIVDQIRQRGVRGGIITGEKDFSLSRQKEMVEAFKKADVEYHFTVIPGMGHDVPDDFPSRLDAMLSEVDGNSAVQENKSTAPTDATVTDIDGNVYRTVTIGNQVWMAKDLKTTRYRNGDVIGTTSPATLDINSESTPKYQWAYAGDESHVTTYGRLYTWFAATDSRNVCPAGWHVPTNAEWDTLTTSLRGEIAAQGKLKEAGTTHWNSPNTDATNESGFTALPGGNRWDNGRFLGLGDFTHWWTATEYDAEFAWRRILVKDAPADNFRGSASKKIGWLVRCVKDASTSPSANRSAQENKSTVPASVPQPSLDVLCLAHTPDYQNGRYIPEPTRNLAFIVNLGGTRFLHMGDATVENSLAHLNASPFDETDVDLLFLPYFDQSQTAQQFIAEKIKPSRIIATHVPPAELVEESKKPKIRAVYPYAIVFKQSMERLSLPIEVDFHNLTGDYLGQKPPGTKPEIFAKGIVSIEGKNTHAVQFSPDGKLLIFSRYPDGTSYQMVESENGWSTPEPTSFRGKEISFDAASKRLFYYDEAGDLLFVRYGPDGFSKPTKLPPTINTKETEYYPSVTAKGNLFFSRNGRWNEARIQVTKLEGDSFGQPVDLGEPINVSGASHEFVSPDESYMLFNSPRTGSHTENDVWVSFHKQDGSWTPPLNLGERINRDAKAVLCPTVSPDGKYIFFTRLQHNLTGYVYWVSAEILTPLREVALSNEAAPKLEITYIANDGFLISSRSQKVLIDSLVAPHTMEYNVPSNELMSQMLAGAAPFDGITTVLVTHPHADHFSDQLTATYLARNPNAVFASTTGAVSPVRKINPELEKRTLIASPGQIRTSRIEKVGGSEIEALWIDHGVQGYDASKFENLAYRFRLSGVSVLHTGDATNWADFRLFDWTSGVDVVLASVWLDDVDRKLEILKNVIKARNVVLMHYVLPRDLDEMQKVAEKLRPHFERVIVFQAPMEKTTVLAKADGGSPLKGDYLGQTPPGATPQIFARGVISTDDKEHGVPSFSPDGNEVYWLEVRPPGANNSEWLTWGMMMRRKNGRWSAPQLSPYKDIPVFSADGRRMYFGAPRTGATQEDGQQDIWVSERQGDGWGEPKCLNLAARSPELKFAAWPTIARNGNLYFISSVPEQQNGAGIARAEFANGEYGKAELLPGSINQPPFRNWAPFIAPDESYLLFSSNRKGSLDNEGDIYISRRQTDGNWSDPVRLGGPVNSDTQERFSRLSVDGKYFFFTRWSREHDEDVYWVEAASVPELNTAGKSPQEHSK